MTLLAALLWLGAAAYGQDYRDYLCRETKEPFFREERSAGGRLLRSARRHSHPASFRVPKPAGTRRVIVAGESAAAILWQERGDPLTRLGGLLWPGARVEHLNAGMTAYNSRRIAAVVEEAAAAEPDLLVVLSGNNEHEALELCPGVWEGLERQFRRSEAFRRADAAGRADAASRGRELSLARHEWHLRRMARAARERGRTLVLATLPANLSGYAPWGGAPFESPAFARGWAAMETGDAAGAERGFRDHLKQAPGEPIGRFYLGRTLEGAGRAAEAREEYEAAVRFDPRGDRASRERNDLLRRVAAEEGAASADLEAAFSGLAPGGIPGDALLADGVHWFPRYNGFASYVLLDAVRRSSAAAAALGASAWDWAALDSHAAALRAPGASPEEAREETRKVLLYGIRSILYWSDADRDGSLAELGVLQLARAYAREPAFVREVSASKRAMRGILARNYWVQDLEVSLEAWWPAYLRHLGEMHRRRGEPERALELFQEADLLAPPRPVAHLHRALALAALGRRAQAERSLAALRAAGRPEARAFSPLLPLYRLK